ncbi:TetR/AcrR family transcriptional regulator [Streptomyces sp. Ru62]|uniref:TetR/AcrR family transcriptional regulator n=1 Tax=Streptomyces sp. Ru62 TaxID=2080745 RepID=UPI0021563DE3|nr:TetR/AcrR family transcriptional regulator [Streptomyces sp. Ru62]
MTIARELLPAVGPTGLSYAPPAERAGGTRQTLYQHYRHHRHSPNRAALLLDLILEGPDLGDCPEPDSEVARAPCLSNTPPPETDHTHR